MLRLIVLLALGAKLSFVITDSSSSEESSIEDSSECEINQICGPNQVYEECPSTCPPRTCKTKDIAFRCMEPLKPGDPKCPRPGCRCANGYYSNDHGKCVLKEQCPKPKCKAYEEYSACPNKVCREKTCDDLGFKLPCYQMESNTTECGRPSCICKQGYVRNKKGICIPNKDCPSCGGDTNAVSGCGTFCNRCNGTVPCPKICRVNSCDCRLGHVYDEVKKKCVLPSQCPKVCKTNEEYEECPNRVCREKTCNDLGFPLACLQSDISKVPCGQPDCICQAGFVRNKNGICIPKRECPSCGGDPNAWSGCGTHCTQCSNYKNPNRVCILLCRLNGCDCRTGHIYDAIKKRCVLPEQCPCGPNEVRSDCANTSCLLEKCSQKDLNIKCKPDRANCKPGCLCAEGYLRDDNGVCIPREKCPPTCSPLEVYSDCANAGCEKRYCSQVTQPALCIDVSESACVGECVCQSDYLRNAAGECVPVSKCPSKEICPKPHEYYDQCPPSCPARRCGTDDRLVRCRAQLPTDECKPTCRCEQGYYRNSVGDCVTFEECSECGPLEVYSKCANAGCDKRNCSQVAEPALCIDVSPENCVGSCVCKTGYLRTAAGVCVPTSDCPTKEICPKPREYYDQCPPSCPARQCGTDDRLVLCDPPSPTAGCNVPSCRCEEGYYRNPQGDCVTFEECPKCGENEVYDVCPSSCPPRTCEAKDRVYKCPAPLQPGDPRCPRPVCRCADNYYKNSDDKCVSKEECFPQCGLNEVASKCANNGCLPNCAQPKRHTYCRPNPANCKSGCVCADGYLRDNNGVCVLKDKCPLKCKENEEYSECPNKLCLPKKCDEIGFQLPCFSNDSNNTECGKPACVCKSGLVRNKDGACVNSKECPSCRGDPNAELGCGSFCIRCSNYKIKNRVCPIGCIRNGCQCRENYVYEEVSKKCVLPKDCPPQCGVNEVPSDCATNTCLPDCSEPQRNLYCKPNPANCKPGCVCADGYLRDKKGVCVLKDKCPPILQCSENEEYSDCPNKVCLPKVCDDLGFPLPCYNAESNNTDCGEPTCICKSGLVRNKDGVCVDPSECSSCGGDPNAERGCGSFCKRCSNYKTKRVACALACMMNGCECRENYVYDDDSMKCVLPKDCPPQCGVNEVPSSCGNNGCLPTCAQPNLNELCDPNPATCKPGCICADGYLRNQDGVCVPKDKCPPAKCRENEVYDECPSSCPPRTCETKDRVYRCKAPLQPGDPLCPRPVCRCADNYYKNSDDKCVLKEDCPPQCGLNEVPSKCANNGCLPDCAQPTRHTYCRPNPANCKPGCVCADGYLRDNNGVCVLKDKCPLKCKDDEEYSDCPNKLCLPKKCDEIGFPLPCFSNERNNTECGKPACICKSGLVRNKDGACVNSKECPSCRGDPNAELGCGTFCTRCSNYKIKNRVCPFGCILNGCQCRENYVYEEVSKKCVLPKDCPPQCGVNEVHSSCGNNGCLPTCAQPNLNELCDPNPATCKPGCICADGYLRDQDGVCVPKDKCPPVNQDICDLPPVTGPCKANMPKYYYNPDKNDCILFTYGGCRGNDNKFDTKAECLAQCMCTDK